MYFIGNTGNKCEIKDYSPTVTNVDMQVELIEAISTRSSLHPLSPHQPTPHCRDDSCFRSTIIAERYSEYGLKEQEPLQNNLALNHDSTSDQASTG
uniref:Uncharacterized protein n=1 Tax=Heterorhabditis bacteriophora TaxID=37862 RepID=A0A1I7WK82_HETBA